MGTKPVATGEGPWSAGTGGTRGTHLLPSGSRGKVSQFSVPCCCPGAAITPAGSAPGWGPKRAKPCYVCKHLSSPRGFATSAPRGGYRRDAGRGHTSGLDSCALLKQRHVESTLRLLTDLCFLCVLSFRGCLSVAAFVSGPLFPSWCSSPSKQYWSFKGWLAFWGVWDGELWLCCFTLKLLLPALDPGAVSLPDLRGRETKIPLLHDLPKFKFH